MGPERRAESSSRQAPRRGAFGLTRPLGEDVRRPAEKFEAMAVALYPATPEGAVLTRAGDPIRVLGNGKRPGPCPPGGVHYDRGIEHHRVTHGDREADIFSDQARGSPLHRLVRAPHALRRPDRRVPVLWRRSE